MFEVGLVEGHQLGMAVDAASGIGAGELPEQRGAHAHFGDHDLLERVFRQPGELQDA